MTKDDWKEGDDVEVSMTYEALPQVPEVDFTTIALEKLVAEIEDDAVDEALAELAALARTTKRSRTRRPRTVTRW